MALWFHLRALGLAVSLVLPLAPKQVQGVPFFYVAGKSGLKPSSTGFDFFQGSLVVDSLYPLYNASSCPFIGFNCLNNGRPDKQYLKYRWKPTGCDLPRFNGQDFLERNIGKKIMFVGDSLSNNMWQSLICMLHVAVPNSKSTLTQKGVLSTFYLEEYEVSIMFLKNGFLVDLPYEKIGKVLKLNSISTGNQWKEVDTLIFNTFHWWTHTGRSQTWDYFQVGDELVKEMIPMEAYKIAVTTWAKWVESNIDFSKTKVFFQGVAAVHLDGKGGQAKVYKGFLSNGQIIAVKRLMKKGKEKENEDRVGDFLAELGIIAHISHPNAARLLGFGIDGGLHLVLQFSPHGSLASLLFGSEESMEKVRFKVAVGIAEGLRYLHHECHRRIIHRDIKASNILLTEDYEAQRSDFGLAKWLPEKWTHHVVFLIEGKSH